MSSQHLGRNEECVAGHACSALDGENVLLEKKIAIIGVVNNLR